MEASHIIRIKTNVEKIRILNGGSPGIVPIGQHLDIILTAARLLEKEVVEAAHKDAPQSEEKAHTNSAIGAVTERNLLSVMYSLLSLSLPYITSDTEAGRDLRSRIDFLSWILGTPPKGAQ